MQGGRGVIRWPSRSVGGRWGQGNVVEGFSWGQSPQPEAGGVEGGFQSEWDEFAGGVGFKDFVVVGAGPDAVEE